MTVTVTFECAQHEWAYMPTTGAVSCVKCQAFRSYDTPEAEAARKLYDACPPLSTPARQDSEQPAKGIAE